MNLIICIPHIMQKGLRVHQQILLTMRLTLLLLTLCCFKVSAEAFAQQISLNVKQAKLEHVFNQIKKQTGYSFWYKDNALDNAATVTLSIKNKPLNEVLEMCFRDQQLTYEVVQKSVYIKAKPAKDQSGNQKPGNVSGWVKGDDGEPLPGASVRVRETSAVTATNQNGYFILKEVADNATLIISYIGFDTKIIPATSERMDIVLTRSSSKLDEVQVIAYGTTMQRLSTGSVGKVTAAEIGRQPVSNPLAALQGRVPGVTIVQQNGVPGSSYTIQVRGQNSLGLVSGTPNSDPYSGKNCRTGDLS